jgi:hypothetical protein
MKLINKFKQVFYPNYFRVDEIFFKTNLKGLNILSVNDKMYALTDEQVLKIKKRLNYYFGVV